MIKHSVECKQSYGYEDFNCPRCRQLMAEADTNYWSPVLCTKYERMKKSKMKNIFVIINAEKEIQTPAFCPTPQAAWEDFLSRRCHNKEPATIVLEYEIAKEQGFTAVPAILNGITMEHYVRPQKVDE